MDNSSAIVDNSARITFGKHKGTRLVDLPDDYLAWLRAKATVYNEELGDAIDDEYYRRLRSRPDGLEDDAEEW